MKVKKFVAKSMPEAMLQIRQELGREAVILNSQEIKTQGIFGFFKKKNIEVIAALDPDPIMQDKENKKSKKSEGIFDYNQLNQNELMSEIQEIKKLFAQQTKLEKSGFTYPYSLLYEQLIEQEVTSELAAELIEDLYSRYQDHSEVTIEQIRLAAKNLIVNQLQEIDFTTQKFTKKIIQLVGPTGVGKTTTIAKIAAEQMLKHKKKIAFITADTYRIGAIEQLKTYAKILDIPLTVVYSSADYKAAIEDFSDYDLILVDTAGRNYREQQYIDDLMQMTSLNQHTGVYLVLALTAKSEDSLEIYEQFKQIPLEGLVFTKLDETIRYGSLYNLPKKSSQNITYITNGQDVPDDLLRIDEKEIAELIISGKSND